MQPTQSTHAERTEVGVGEAMRNAENTAARHNAQAIQLLGSMILIILTFLLLHFYLIYHSPTETKIIGKTVTVVSKEDDKIARYVLYGIVLFTIGILAAFYRQHQKDAARFEHYAFALHRIYVAAANTPKQFEGDVRTVLIQGAFQSEESSNIVGNKKAIESPLPGHPAADAAIELLNKVVDVVKPLVNKEKGG